MNTRNFFLNDPPLLVLIGITTLFSFLIWLLGTILIPIVLAGIFAYLLDIVWKRLHTFHLPQPLAFWFTYLLFLLLYALSVLGPLQLASRQSLILLQALPPTLPKALEALEGIYLKFAAQYATIPGIEIKLAATIGDQLQSYGETFIKNIVGGVPEFTGVLVGLALIPVLVLFFMQDLVELKSGIKWMLPKNIHLVKQVFEEMRQSVMAYLLSKLVEVLALSIVTGVVFKILGFDYAEICGLMAGLAALIPFVGVVLAAVPVIVLGYLQWGFGAEWSWLFGWFILLQTLDAYLLVPLMFSETIKLQPSLILVGVIVFGSIWGVWGVFFSIPLVSLCKIMITTWLNYRRNSTSNTSSTG